MSAPSMRALDALRLRAEIETAGHTSKTRRPTWAPAFIMSDELENLCRDLKFLQPFDQPIGRIWAIFVSPTQAESRIVGDRKFDTSAMRCWGFELIAGEQHTRRRTMARAMMSVNGDWRDGWFWKKSSPRFVKLTEMTALATAALYAFADDPEIYRAQGAMLTGHCAICGRGLTDPPSLERGIGPECVRHLLPPKRLDVIDKLLALKLAMADAHPDHGGTDAAFIAAHIKFKAAKNAAEREVAT